MAAALPAAAADGPSAIPQSHPQWATPQSKVADVAAGSAVTFRVYLKTRNEAGAEAVAKAVSDPTSSAYGQYLSPAQVKAQFAPTQSQVDSVRGWLGSSGFAIDSVPSNNAFVEATGTAAQIDSAFNVHLGKYQVNGQTLRAPDTNLSIPAQLTSVVLGTVGVDQSENLLKPNLVGGPTDAGTSTTTVNQVTPGVVPPPSGFRNARPCSDFFGQKIDTTDPTFNGQQLPYAPCGYVPSQLRGAYGIDKTVAAGIDGRGVTVAIVDAFGSPNLFADAAQYAQRNDPAHPLLASQFTQQVAPPTPGQEDPSQCGAAGWYGEQTLDVEALILGQRGDHRVGVAGDLGALVGDQFFERADTRPDQRDLWAVRRVLQDLGELRPGVGEFAIHLGEQLERAHCGALRIEHFFLDAVGGQLGLDLRDVLLCGLDFALKRAKRVLPGALVELVDQLLAELEQRARHPLRVFRAVGLDLQRADAADRVALDRDETVIDLVQRLKILAPEPDPGEAGDQVAFRPAEDAP